MPVTKLLIESEILNAYFNSYAQTKIFFIKSGFPNEVIFVQEDPYFGLDATLISIEKYRELIIGLEKDVKNGKKDKI
jgi:hypothetical protein